MGCAQTWQQQRCPQGWKMMHGPADQHTMQSSSSPSPSAPLAAGAANVPPPCNGLVWHDDVFVEQVAAAVVGGRSGRHGHATGLLTPQGPGCRSPVLRLSCPRPARRSAETLAARMVALGESALSGVPGCAALGGLAGVRPCTAAASATSSRSWLLLCLTSAPESDAPRVAFC